MTVVEYNFEGDRCFVIVGEGTQVREMDQRWLTINFSMIEFKDKRDRDAAYEAIMNAIVSGKPKVSITKHQA